VEEDQTRIVTASHEADPRLDERVHCLEALEGDHGLVRRFVIPQAGAVIGRSPPAELVLADSEASRAHCRLTLAGDVLTVTDLNSTNGTFLDGTRLQGAAPLPVGAVLRVGQTLLRHEWRTCLEVMQSAQMDRDLAAANSYIHALLPPPITDPPIRADWIYEPSAKVGGDAFGYGPISDAKFAFYLMDVSGHGAGAAMHSVAVMNLLRQRALPDTDMADPGQVLTTLNTMFQMERHAEMYFTVWYGVFDRTMRNLAFASAGHHPAYLVGADRAEAVPLSTKNGLIGAALGRTYLADTIQTPPGATVFLFSDGVFEIVTNAGLQWGLRDFLPLILKPPVAGMTQCQRIFRDVTSVARPGGFDDDFSLVALTFD
jgi:hypothetical protein